MNSESKFLTLSILTFIFVVMIFFMLAFLLVRSPHLQSSDSIINNKLTCEELEINYYNCRSGSSAIYWDYCNVYVDIAHQKNCGG